MDIALRKDLIDIQELIANPPPPPQASKSSKQHLLSDHAHRDHIEQRFGQLYSGSTNHRLAQQQALVGQSHRHGHNRSRHKHSSRHQAHLSSDDSSELEHRMARLHLSSQHTSRRHRKCHGKEALRVRGGDAQHLLDSSVSFLRCSKIPMEELAVDVPAETDPQERVASNNDNKLVNSKSGAFSSLHSLAPVASHSRHQTRSGHKRDERTKTIAYSSSQADLHLLPMLNASRDVGAKKRVVKGAELVASSLELSGDACLPDARDNPTEWAHMMAKSALYRSTNSPVIESKLEECDQEPTGANNSFKLSSAKGRAMKGAKLPSPTGSIRSMLSKSQGRLIVRRRKQKGSLLVRRPNLGTCVGKLSLLKLRGMVNKRSNAREVAVDKKEENEETFEELEEGRQEEEVKEEVEQLVERKEKSEQEASGEANDNSATKNAPTAAQRRPVAAGRRQERIERLEQSSSVRAPNGSQLMRTRPLASLNDETQLYAIPKKSKVSCMKAFI